MASIEKRHNRQGKPSYRVKIRLKGFEPVSGTFDRLTDAREWARQTEADIKAGRYFHRREAERHTLLDLIHRYTDTVLPDKSSSSHRNQFQQLTWWAQQLSHLRLMDVTPAVVAEKRDKLRQEGRSPATCNRYLAALSHAFSIASREWAWVEDNPVFKVRKLREPKGRDRFLNEQELPQFLDACKASGNHYLYPAVVLSLATGGRQQEILGLKWKHVDLYDGRVTFHRTKNKEKRSVALRGHALDVLREHAKIRLIGTDLLFPSHRNPAKPIDLRKPFEKALKSAEIEEFSWHCLRHSAASYLVMSGASLVEVATILGHKSLSVVQRYSHLNDGHTAETIEKLDDTLFGDR